MVKILDTDTCIEILRGNLQVVQRRVSESADVATTWMTASELYFGAHKSDAPSANAKLVTEFLSTLPILEMNRSAADLFGKVKAQLESSGRRLPDADLLIGALAISWQAPVVTGNGKHFARIPGIKIENWIR